MKKYRFMWSILLLAVLIGGTGYGILMHFSGTKMQKEEPYSGETDVIEKQSFDEFATEIVDLIKEYDGDKIDKSAILNPFYSRRLIVQGVEEELDLKTYGAKIVVCGPDNMYVMQFTTQEAAEKACGELQEIPSIEYCEPDQYIEISEKNGGQEAMSWGVSVIGADTYAEHVQSVADDNIIVAVIDTGISENQFLEGRVAANGMDFVDNDLIPDDRHSHGTHVSGTIVDCTPNLNVRILPVKVLGTDGSGSWLRVSLGIRYAANQGAQILNLSLGGGLSKTVDNAIAYAMDEGCTVVVAAGNDNDDTSKYSPAHLSECIVVSAVDNTLQKADFSNWGESVDVAAPGVDIVSCAPNLFYGCAMGSTKKSMSGTSMATPHVAALAAMIKLESPSLTAKEIANVIAGHCTDLGEPGWDSDYGWGIPDFNAAADISVPPADEPLQTDSAADYEDILEEYRALAESSFDSNLYGQMKYVNDGVQNFRGQEQYSVYYRIADLAGDGNPELMISVNEKEAPKNIVDIYGMEDGAPVRIIENSPSVGYRSRYYITQDGRIKNKGSDGALDSQISYYRLPENSASLEEDEQFIYDGWDGDTYTHIDSVNVSFGISKEEYTYFSSDEDVDFESDWELLYEGHSIHDVE